MRKVLNQALPFTIVEQSYTIGEFFTMSLLCMALFFVLWLACAFAYATMGGN